MASEESHDIPSASCRTGKANGVYFSLSPKTWEPGHQWYNSQLETEGLRMYVLESSVPRIRSSDVWEEERNNVPLQEERERVCFPPFCSTWALNRLDNSTHIGEGRSSLPQSTDSNALSLPETPSQIHLEIIFYWRSGHPLALSSWQKINCHSSCSITSQIFTTANPWPPLCNMPFLTLIWSAFLLLPLS